MDKDKDVLDYKEINGKRVYYINGKRVSIMEWKRAIRNAIRRIRSKKHDR